MDLANKVVLITGASSGIGRAAAFAFDRAGARVALAARRRQRLEENAACMTGALVVPTDLSDASQAAAMVDTAVDHFGRLDVLVNNAGIGVICRGDRVDAAVTRRVLETNLIGAMIATERAIPHMRRQGRGHIINVTSPAGFLGVPMMAAYSASKGAMSGWTRSLQAEWSGSEIFVTEYQPGLIDTEMHDATTEASGLKSLGTEVFQDPDQSAIVKWFNRPLRAEKVARDLVDCARRPRLQMCSSAGVRFGLWLAAAPSIRCSIGAGMARAFRKRLGLPVFSES